MATLVSDKADLRTRNLPSDKEGHCIMIRINHQEDIAMLNGFPPNTLDSK